MREHGLQVNGWKVSLQNVYYTTGFLVLMGTIIGAWTQTVSNQNLMLYQMAEVRAAQAVRDKSLADLSAKVNDGAIQRGKLEQQLAILNQLLTELRSHSLKTDTN